MRIVSLLPAATEMVCGLGLINHLVGISHECEYPDAVQKLPRVTATKIRANASSRNIDTQVREQLQSQASLYSLDIDTLKQLQPDLIVTQTLCNVCAVSDNEIQSLLKQLDHQPKIVNLAPTRLTDIFDGIHMIANAAGIAEQGERYVNELLARVQSVARKTENLANRPRVLLLEWLEPLFCAGHWSPELVRIAGGDEAIGIVGQTSHTISWDDVHACDPDVLIIACCGFDIARTRKELLTLDSLHNFSALSCTQNRRSYIVDGNAYFNRPGPRLVDAIELLAHLFHPDVLSLPRHVLPAVPLTVSGRLHAIPSHH